MQTEDDNPIVQLLSVFGFTPKGLGLFFIIMPFVAAFLGPYTAGVLGIIIMYGFIKTIAQTLKNWRNK